MVIIRSLLDRINDDLRSTNVGLRQIRLILMVRVIQPMTIT
jgi:hypothetical protein